MAAVSRTFCGSFSSSAILVSSLSAWVRFRWVLSLATVRRCHLRSLYWRSFSSRVRVLPVASWLLQLMVVLSPLSWISGVSGAPTRVRFSVCSGLKALLSDPVTIRVSFRTTPHFVQICSPVQVSVIMSVLPHSHACFNATFVHL